MLKVVIADDEARVCRLVQMLADWDALGMEVVGTASNGFEALELVERLTPDILVTDIRMPGCDGLELIAKAKAVAPDLEIALISGYAQFEYAQIAMRYDVGGYLLKPIKKDVLTAALEKLGKKCRERAASAAILERLQRDSDKSHDLLRNRLPEDLMRNRLESPSRGLLLEEYDFEVYAGLLQVLILKMDYEPENVPETSMHDIQKKVAEIFDSAVFHLCTAHAFQFHDSAGYGVLNYDPPKSNDIRRAMRQCLNQLEAQKFIFSPVEFSLALGKAVESAEELPLSMREAQRTIAERIVEGTGRLLDVVLPASEFGSRETLDKYSRTLARTVDTLSVAEADKAVDELISEVASGVCGYELLDLVLAAGRMFAIRLDMNEKSEIIREFEERCGLCGSADKLFGCLRDFQRNQITAVLERRENEAIRPIRIAKQYIHRHYNEPITLEDVCAATGFSASYFSTMFKKETGEGFSKYLTRVRIEQAQALLRDTGLPIVKICEQVGYNDLKHFTGTFKKMTSLNPGQYRKLYG